MWVVLLLHIDTSFALNFNFSTRHSTNWFSFSWSDRLIATVWQTTCEFQHRDSRHALETTLAYRESGCRLSNR